MSQRHQTTSATSFSSHLTTSTPNSQEIQRYVSNNPRNQSINVRETHTSNSNMNTTVMRQTIPFSNGINHNNQCLTKPTYAQLLSNINTNNRVVTEAHHSNPNSTRVAPLLPRCASKSSPPPLVSGCCS